MMACLMVSVTLTYHLYKDIFVSCDFFSYLFLTERLNSTFPVAFLLFLLPFVCFLLSWAFSSVFAEKMENRADTGAVTTERALYMFCKSGKRDQEFSPLVCMMQSSVVFTIHRTMLTLRVATVWGAIFGTRTVIELTECLAMNTLRAVSSKTQACWCSCPAQIVCVCVCSKCGLRKKTWLVKNWNDRHSIQ